MNKRLLLGVISGAILGIFCIIGASTRLGWEGNQLLIFALWYNRLVLGLLIGLAGNLIISTLQTVSQRGAAYFLTSGASDWVSFIAGVICGVIIEFVLKRYANPQAQ